MHMKKNNEKTLKHVKNNPQLKLSAKNCEAIKINL